jgi:serine/threonine protein kinase
MCSDSRKKVDCHDMRCSGERMVEVLNDVQEQASMLKLHRDDAIAELLRLKQPEPQIRHRESLTSYVDVRLLPKEGIAWSGGILPEQLVVEKRCFGSRYELIQHEKAVLESLRTDRIGDAVFGMVGQFEYSDSTHDDPLIGVRLQYGGLDLSKWNQICYSNESRLDPFCHAPFLLQLARRVLGCLFILHSNGYIHCDLKLDNICARTRRVSRQGDHLVGAIDLQTLKLIDFGLSIMAVQNSGHMGQLPLR